MSGETTTTLAGSLDRFANALTQNTAASAKLEKAVRASDQVRNRRVVVIGIAVVAVALLIVLNLVFAVAALKTQATIKDCTDPTGKCARRSASQTVAVVGNLTQSDLTVSYTIGRCRIGDPPVDEFTTCINRTFAAIKRGTITPPKLP